MSHNLENLSVWLIGAGPMAIEHAKVLQYLGIDFLTIGRGEKSATKFEQEIKGVEVYRGGLEDFLQTQSPNSETKVIVAVGAEVLIDILRILVKRSFHSILVEKPGAISAKELLNNRVLFDPYSKKIFIAYNRRYYNNIIELKKRLVNEGGVSSFYFDFTEWSHKIGELSKAPGVKENWLFANSSHIIDLAFYLGGQPVNWDSWVLPGSLKWHVNSRYVGAGITDSGATFSYHSNWESAGRWYLEICTNQSKYILSPIEELKMISRGSINQIKIEIDNEIFKPGLLGMIKDFVHDQKKLKTLEEQLAFAKSIILKITNSIP